jgi:Leucine-rich repeat (LRR) protein
VIANATIVASSNSNSGSNSTACGLTQGEVDAMNTAFGLSQIDQEWCDTTYLNINGQLINTTALSGIMKLVNLTDLTLEDASISNIPSSIGNLVNLSYLNLNGNTFSSIPESIGNLTNLYSLNLAWNSNLINLPDSL